MKGKHIAVMVLGGFCLIWFIWALFGWATSPKYDASVTAEDIQSMLSERGLETCSTDTLYFEKVPGFIEGKTATLSTACDDDANPLKITFLKFESEESRNAAQQRVASTHRGGYGPHAAYAYGPYVITINGTRGIGDQLLLGKILSETAQD